MPEPTSRTVVVTRDGADDPRRAAVPLDELRNPHFADRRGGDYRPLPVPVLAVYVNCDAIPEGVPFGHTCHHGGRLHSIRVLVDETRTDPATIATLSAAATACRTRPRPKHRSTCHDQRQS